MKRRRRRQPPHLRPPESLLSPPSRILSPPLHRGCWSRIELPIRGQLLHPSTASPFASPSHLVGGFDEDSIRNHPASQGAKDKARIPQPATSHPPHLLDQVSGAQHPRRPPQEADEAAGDMARRWFLSPSPPLRWPRFCILPSDGPWFSSSSRAAPTSPCCVWQMLVEFPLGTEQYTHRSSTFFLLRPVRHRRWHQVYDVTRIEKTRIHLLLDVAVPDEPTWPARACLMVDASPDGILLPS